MIKRFIEKIEETSTEAMVTILYYIDDKLDAQDDRLDRLEEKIDEFEDQFNSTKAEVDSQANTRKLIKKTVVTGVISAIIAFILRHLGIF